ncbi:hypothetical protein SAMN05444350_110123 [Bacteroides stercorirosoris]|jgi:hypothetical protein|uniref:Uncharacterized protein n=1 Tax=Bacteroides stercorirosoris TaxID=871324 RepID=A0A1M6EXI6_9BACE|nr:hypothetical protein SAMN05444350_110123 [Bacteroides stercorirosoris]
MWAKIRKATLKYGRVFDLKGVKFDVFVLLELAKGL